MVSHNPSSTACPSCHRLKSTSGQRLQFDHCMRELLRDSKTKKMRSQDQHLEVWSSRSTKIKRESWNKKFFVKSTCTLEYFNLIWESHEHRTQMINILVPTLKDEEILENPLQMNIVWLVIKSGRAVVELQCKLWGICIPKSLHENHPWIIYRDEPLLSTIVCEEEWALHLLLSVSKHEHGHYLWHTIPSLLLLSCHAYPTQALRQDCNGCWSCCHFDPTQWENMLFGPLEVQLCISIDVILLGGSSLQRSK